MTVLNKQDLINISYGSTFLASGGGGALLAGFNLLEHYEGTTTMVSKEEAVADTDAYTLVVAYIGAPDGELKIFDPKAVVDAFNMMNDIVGGKIKYTVPVETGAISTICSCVAANALNIAVIDGDGAGRAVPSLTMLTFANNVPMGNGQKAQNGQLIPAAVLSSHDGQQVEVFVNSPSQVEAIARPFISSGIPGFDETAGLAIWLMDSSTLNKALKVTGSIARSLALGQLLSKSYDGSGTPATYGEVTVFLQNAGLDARALFYGTMKTPQEITQGGFDLDKIVISNADTGVDLHIYAQNENLFACRSDRPDPIIISPDSICYLAEDGKTFSNADILANPANPNTDPGFVGKNVYVFAIKALPEFAADASIVTAFRDAMTNLGYPGPYIPWDKIANQNQKEIKKK